MKKFLLIVTILATFTALAVAQGTAKSFTFFADKQVFAPSSTHNIVTMCAVQTGSGAGNSQTIVEDNYLIFRFGVGNGTLNSVSNLRVVPWFLPVTPPTDVVVNGDFGTPVVNSVANKATIEYENATAHVIPFQYSLCLDADWDAPTSAGEKIVDLTVTLDPAHPINDALQFFIKN